MDKVYLGVIVVLILIIAYMFVQPSLPSTDREKAAQAIKDIYELQYETDVTIDSIQERSGIYQVTARFTDFSGRNVTQDVFITKDGELITDRFVIAENYRALLAGQKAFVECLRDRGVRVLGQTNDTATLQQLALLGTYSYKLFVSCDAPNEQSCRNLGVDRYPTAVYNSTGYPNIFPPGFFANLTGCALS